MLVTIIGKNNAAGLEKDRRILEDLLLVHGHSIDFRDMTVAYEPLNDKNELCIFTEGVSLSYIGKRNILIPNQEWFFLDWLPVLKQIDAVFCKTRHAQSIFERLHPKVVYTGFTSIDCFRSSKKKYEFFHSQGLSKAKGTKHLVSTWIENPGYMPLHLISKNYSPKADNIILYPERLDDQNYFALMNQSLIHIYPSLVEGFGHCINEARSCGSVVITTNHPPMNEIIKRFLIRPDGLYYYYTTLGEFATVNIGNIEEVISGLPSQDELIEIGKQNRQDFLNDDALFKERFIEELNKL